MWNFKNNAFRIFLQMFLSFIHLFGDLNVGLNKGAMKEVWFKID